MTDNHPTTRFTLSELPFVIAQIWDRGRHDDTLLTLVTYGKHCTGYLELAAPAISDGDVVSSWRWQWSAVERGTEEGISGLVDTLDEAVEMLVAGMRVMDDSLSE